MFGYIFSLTWILIHISSYLEKEMWMYNNLQVTLGFSYNATNPWPAPYASTLRTVLTVNVQCVRIDSLISPYHLLCIIN